jgi:hypothetical protein
VLGEYKKSNYLTSLCTLFECESSKNRIEVLAATPKKIDIRSLMSTLESDARKYAWCLDAMFIGNENGTNPKTKSAVIQMCKVFGMKENEISKFIEQIGLLVSENVPMILFQAISTINRYTDAWRTILDYKRISLKGAFDDIKKQNDDCCKQAIILSFNCMNLTTKLLDCSFAMGDENFLQRSALNLQRTSVISEFNELKTKIENFESKASKLISDSNSILHMFGTEWIDVSHPISLYNINADEASGIGNENWGDNMSNALENLSNYVDAYSDTLIILNEQLALYEGGKYHESAVENRKKAAQKAKAQKMAEEEKKKSVKIDKGGQSASLKLTYEKITKLPFDFSEISDAKAFNNKWYLATSKQLWEYNDAQSWTQVSLPVKMDYFKLYLANNTLVVVDSEKYCFTTNGIDWDSGRLPERSSSIADLVYYPHWNNWIAHTHSYDAHYTYMKEGLIWDSEESGTATCSNFYRAETLDGEWTKMSNFSSLPTGQYVTAGSIFANQDGLFALISYDYSYMDNKHIISQGAHFAYSLGQGDKEWSSADFPTQSFKSFDKIDNEVMGKIIFTKYGFICANYKGIYTSTDGKKWEKTDDNYSGSSNSNFIEIGNLVAFNNSKSLYVTVDGITFQEMLLEHRSDIVSAIKDKILLVDRNKNNGGVFLCQLQLS